mmetsp:Transcript_4540/g.6856  ORF Transcript_4540/g.6856 Transcript_4540/m.6856 type:complete len:102 (+) Transcript_4540:908-1213(+)
MDTTKLQSIQEPFLSEAHRGMAQNRASASCIDRPSNRNLIKFIQMTPHTELCRLQNLTYDPEQPQSASYIRAFLILSCFTSGLFAGLTALSGKMGMELLSY